MALGQNIPELARRLHRFFKSLKLTASVMAGLIMVYFLGLVLPQKWMFEGKEQYEQWLSESLLNWLLDLTGFTEIYTSPLTIILLGVFFINLLLVIDARIPLILKKSFIGGGPPRINAAAVKASERTVEIQGGVDAARVAHGLRGVSRRLGYGLMQGEAKGTFMALKHRFSPIGFLLFHLSFLLCLLGALTISYTRFSGKLTLTEGQSFKGDIKQFHRIIDTPKMLKALPELRLRLEEVHPTYEHDVPSSLEALLMVSDSGGARMESVDVNKPVRRGALTIHANAIGVSPLVEIIGPSGQVIDGAYVSLNVLNDQTDSFKFDTDSRYNFEVLFYPDHEVVDGRDTTRSIEMNNPVFYFMITEDDWQVFRGTVRPGQLVEFGNFKLKVSDIKYWVEFLIVREYGKYPLTVGFIFAAVGLVMRLIFYQKRILLVQEPHGDGQVVYIDGKSEYFPHSFGQEIEHFHLELSKEFEEASP